MAVNLFDEAEKHLTKVVRDPGVFDRDFMPSSVPVLEDRPRPDPDNPSKMLPGGATFQLVMALVPFKNGERSGNILLTGLSGWGKSLCAKRALLQLRQAMGPERCKTTLFVEVNGHSKTTLAIFRAILAAADPNQASAAANETDVDRLITSINHELGRRYKQFLLVIDEACFLKGHRNDRKTNKGDPLDPLQDLTPLQNAYYLLTEKGTFAIPPTLLLIAPTEARFVDMPPAVKTRMAYTLVPVAQYNAEDLTKILRQRAELGLVEGAVDDGVLAYCGAVASRNLNASAAGAISLLKAAAEGAQKRQKAKVSNEDVGEALEVARKDVSTMTFDKATVEQKNVLCVISVLEQAKVLRPSIPQIHAAYNAVCDRMGTDRVGVSKLREFLLEPMKEAEWLHESKKAGPTGGRPRFFYELVDPAAVHDLYSTMHGHADEVDRRSLQEEAAAAARRAASAP